MFRYSTFSLVLLTVACLSSARAADATRYAQTHSRGQYVHWIDLYDANDKKIDLTDESAAPYSPEHTCGRCHDYKAIASGHHFNGLHEGVEPGRPGEPWIWTDDRTGTQIPMSYRGWEGTYDPGTLGVSSREFVLKFGSHIPGGGPGEAVPEAPEEVKEGDDAAEKAAEEAARWKLSGMLNVDCMICHARDYTFSPELWWEQVQVENFAWASTAAIGLGSVDGEVSSLPDDFDPATAEEDSRHKLPTVTYSPARVNADGELFFDVIRKPNNNACYYCHSTNPVGESAHADWTRDEDVHLRAGFDCADCHSNGISHHTVRAFEGEEHATGEHVETLSCEGCHLNDGHGGGRMGAPKPLHKGLPPLHFEKLSCTACHSGPKIADQAELVQTSLAHALGQVSHGVEHTAPGIMAPVMMRDDHDKLYPHRAVWPAFWGQIADDVITPLNPEEVYDAIRGSLRIKRGSTFAAATQTVSLSSADKKELLGEDRYKLSEEELTDEENAKLAELTATQVAENWQEKLAGALEDLKEIITTEGAEPVFVSAGRAYRLAAAEGEEEEPTAEAFEHAAAEPYAWKFGHDVRPARQSLGVKGCYDCHSLGSPIFNSTVTAVGQAPDAEPVTKAMHEMAGYDKLKLDAWSLSFLSRKAFKYFGYGAMGLLGLVLLAFILRGIVAVGAFICRQ